jgi:hypothetical protein
MGDEIVCRGSLGAQTSEGKALLESDHLLFRGEFRCKIFFRDLAKISADRGILSLFGPEGELRLELGKKATVWSEKILHPKSRAEKLGLKAGTKVLVINLADTEFQAELAKSAGRAAGLKDVKVVSFSSTQTALKFVRPLQP